MRLKSVAKPKGQKPTMNTSIRKKQDVLSILRLHADQIRGLGVKRLGLFGSFARGHADADSDVDLSVEFGQWWGEAYGRRDSERL